MKLFTRFLFLSALCMSLFSCIEETSQSIISSPEESIEQGEPNSSFEIGYDDADITHGYIRTTAMPDGETFSHHLVLSATDVFDGDDLRSNTEVPTVAILLESNRLSPAGEYKRNDGLVDAAASMEYNVTQGPNLYRHQVYDSESTVTITTQGDELIVMVDIFSSNLPSLTIRGSFRGPVVPVEPNAGEVSDEEFTGQNFMSRDAETFDLTNAYLVQNSSGYKLFLSEEPVHQAAQLTGTSNVMMMYLSTSSNGELRTGRYQIDRESFGGTGYFSTEMASTIGSTFFCRDMNFATNNMADDEGMETGETLVQTDGDQFKIKFDFISTRNGHVEGEFQGTILNAVQ
jgi:hypothetical protein